MPDIFVPGVKSRFDTEKIVSGLMEVERIPRNRVVNANDTLVAEKEGWQELGRRITTVRENARMLFSHQNPFNERAAVSADDSVLSATSTREAKDQDHSFTVKQIATADRLLSNPLDKNYQVPAGNYAFSTGKSDVAFNYKGGNVQDFAETINRRANGKLKAGTISAQPGTNSFVIESMDTGAANKLTFSADALSFAVQTGIIGQGKTEPKMIPVKAIDSGNGNLATGAGPSVVQASVQGDALRVPAMGQADISLNGGIVPSPTMMLKFETAVSTIGLATENSAAASGANAPSAGEAANSAENDLAGNNAAAADESSGQNVLIATQDALDGEVVEGKYSVQKQRAGGAILGGSVTTIDNADNLGLINEDAAPPEQAAAAGVGPVGQTASDAPQPPRVDNLSVLSLYFSDGTSIDLPAINDSPGFSQNQFQLAQLADGKTVSSIRINNDNTHREIAMRNIQLFDPMSTTGSDPLHPVSKAQDAIIEMDGIEVKRPTNNINDLIPGVNLTARAPSDFPVRLDVKTDTESVKDAIITMVGNYNRLMAELNVLTRTDEGVLREFSYLSAEELEQMRKKLGMFSGDSTLGRFRSNLQQIVTASYPTTDGNAYMLSAFGISTDARRSGGYDPTKLRGYLEIDEKALDLALQTKLPEMQQVFGKDSDGDLIVDSGLAYSLEQTVRPYVELGGIIATKTGGIDSRLASNNRRIETMDRQLEQKEQTLKTQYGQIEGAYSRMEKLQNSLDQFSQQGRQ